MISDWYLNPVMCSCLCSFLRPQNNKTHDVPAHNFFPAKLSFSTLSEVFQLLRKWFLKSFTYTKMQMCQVRKRNFTLHLPAPELRQDWRRGWEQLGLLWMWKQIQCRSRNVGLPKTMLCPSIPQQLKRKLSVSFPSVLCFEKSGHSLVLGI